LKLFAKSGTVFDRVMDILVVVACVIFTFAMLLVCADVIMRYAFNHPIKITLEICEYILVGIVSLGMAWLLREEGHVKIDFLLSHFNSGQQALITGITSAIGAVFVLIITWYGAENTFSLMQRPFAVETGILRIHKSVLLIPLAIGCFLFFIQLIRRAYKHLKMYKSLKNARAQ